MNKSYWIILGFISCVFAYDMDYEDFSAYCPRPGELIKTEDATWVTKNDWRSFNPSFIDKVTIFLGAQWQGEKIGQLLCRYSNQSSINFPVTLQAPFLSKEPKGRGWKKDFVNFNTFNCYALRIEDCPVVGVRKKELQIDTEESLKSFLQSIKQ